MGAVANDSANNTARKIGKRPKRISCLLRNFRDSESDPKRFGRFSWKQSRDPMDCKTCRDLLKICESWDSKKLPLTPPVYRGFYRTVLQN
jgi:hypothetical protein